MINWNFNPDEAKTEFETIPEGKYRVRIDKAETAVSKSGYDMIKLELAVSGFRSKLFYYLVFMPENSSITNSNLARLWDSFGIAHNNLDEQSWVGKSGACMVKNREYNGEQRPNISYFIDKSKQDSLPPWQDTDMTPTAFDPNDLPF